MIQHIISRWLLSAFARDGELAMYDKSADSFDRTSPAGFLVEQDAHSARIEDLIEAIETPAAQAGRALGKLFRPLRAGMYALTDEGSVSSAIGPEMVSVGELAGTTLVVPSFSARWPAPGDRQALARYIGLMYQRSPKLEEAMRQWGLAFDRAAQPVLDAMVPGMRTGLHRLEQTARGRMIPRTETIGHRLEMANWFVVRSPETESFVLGDSPVTATIALGHDDTWRAIFADEAFVIVMPIGPKIALVVAPMAVPFSRIEARDLTRTINRISWRSAERFILARDQATLEAAAPAPDERQITVPVEVDSNLDAKAVATVLRVLDQAMRPLVAAYLRDEAATWTHWEGCRIVIGRVLLPVLRMSPDGWAVVRGGLVRELAGWAPALA